MATDRKSATIDRLDDGTYQLKLFTTDVKNNTTYLVYTGSSKKLDNLLDKVKEDFNDVPF